MGMAQESIYVAQGLGGLLKAGRTKDASARRVGLRKEFRKKGDVLARFHACAPGPNGYVAENHLLSVLESHLSRHSGKEWFYGGEFVNATRAAEEVSKYVLETYLPPLWRTDPEAWKAQCAEAQARYAQEKAKRQAEMRERNARIAARRLVREFRATVLHRVAQALCASGPRADAA